MEPAMLTLLAAGLSAVAAFAAALAAWFSLSHARQQKDAAAQQATDLEKRELLRDIAQQNREAIAIGQRVEKLAVESVALRRALAIHQGGLGGEQQRHFDSEISELSHQVAAAIQGLNGIFDEGRPVDAYDMQELRDIHAQFSRQRGEAGELLRDLELKYTGVVAALAPFEAVAATAPSA
jgi:hypothetical protein